MREIVDKVYTIDELDEVSKQFAISKYRENENFPGDYWNETLLDTLQGELKDKGYPDSRIAYSGFWSQGDGASFTCEGIDIHRWLELKPQSDYKRILKLLKSGFIEVYSAKIVRDKWHNYVHENTTSAYVSFLMYGKLGTSAVRVEEVLCKIEMDINTEIKELNKDIYSRLQKEYDECTTDEAVIDEIRENNLEFYENGRLYN